MKKNNKKFITIFAIVFLVLGTLFFKLGFYRTLAESDQDILFPKLDAEFSSNFTEVIFPNDVTFNTKIKGVKRDQMFSYSFWYNCKSDSTDYFYLTKSDVCGDPTKDSAIGVRFANVKSVPVIPKRIYPNAGNYTAKILVERGTEKVEKRLNIMVKPKIDFWVNGISNNAVDIEYGGSINIKWEVTGLSSTGKCVSSWGGEKPIRGEQKITEIIEKSNKLTMTCTELDGAKGVATVDARLVPKITIQAKDSENPTQNKNDVLGEGTLAFNAAAVITWNSYGADATNSTPCTGYGSDASWDGKLFAANGSFVANKVMTNTKYGLKCRGLGGTGESSIILKIDQGNCSFEGNNNIRAAVFCTKKLVVINDGSNVDMVGAFVAKRFDITNESKNIRFYYDPKTEMNWPPGFRYLDFSQLNEVANN